MQPRISPNSLYYGLLTGIHITIKQSVNHNKDCQAISNQNSQGAIWYQMEKLTGPHLAPTLYGIDKKRKAAKVCF